MGKSVTLAMKVIGSWNWAQNVYFDERNNFVGEGILVIPLVFNIIDVIGLIDSRYLGTRLGEKWKC